MISSLIIPLLRWERFIGLAILLWCSPSAGAADNNCASMQQVPFIGGSAGKSIWRMLSQEGSYCLIIDGQRLVRLNDVIPLSVERIGNGLLVFGRRRISNYLAVLSVPDNGPQTYLEMTFDESSKLHLEGTFVIGDSAYFLAYDVAHNLPSGRRRAVPKEVLSLYKINHGLEGHEIELIDDEFLKAGLETGVRISASGSEAWICFASDCIRLFVSANGKLITEPAIPIIFKEKKLEVLELSLDNYGKGYALAIATFDDRTESMPASNSSVYFLCHLSISAACEGLAASEIPYRLRIEDGHPNWDKARKAEDISALLAYDLARSGLSGAANFGENNLEGRLAWSQTYYLNGLLSMIRLSSELGLEEPFKTLLQKRFAVEAEETAALATLSYPGFMVKRYSLDREPLISLLHIGRILKPIWRGAEFLPSKTSSLFDSIGSQFSHAYGAIEVYQLPQVSSLPIARFRKFIPFWSDGGDLPWNVRSSWIENLVWSPKKPLSSNELAKELTKEFIQKELLVLPEKWRYAAGNTHSGWSAHDNVSSNTPAYVGDTANQNGAHISYRSIDAIAVLAAERVGIIDKVPIITRHIKSLVSRGLLYPFVNEEFALRGEPIDIPISVGRLYARTNLPWQVQNQPWALLSLPAK